MVFASLQFLLQFLPVFLVATFLLRAMAMRRSVVLTAFCLASIVFYAAWDPWNLIILTFAMGTTFTHGMAIEKTSGQAKVQRLILASGIAINVALIVWFKYRNFLVGNPAPLILPLGISFIVFQKIAWLVDVRRGLARADSPLDFIFFVTFFPQLIAGPIVHYRDVVPQTKVADFLRFDPVLFTSGTCLFAIGLAKKLLIADRLAPMVNELYAKAAAGQTLSFWEAWGAAFGFGLQLYFDFSGYADMAVGLAAMVGILLPINFFSPYRADTIIAFWRRWHITLSHWLRDYIFIPLGGSRRGFALHLANLMVTMLIGGLWHGAAWTFVVWGGLHGALLAIAHTWRKLVAIHIPRVIGWGLTLLAVMALWIFFRAPDLSTALSMSWSLLPRRSALVILLPDMRTMIDAVISTRVEALPVWIAGTLLLALLPKNSLQLVGLVPGSTEKPVLPPLAQGLLAGFLIAAALRTLLEKPSTEFLYFAF